MTKFILAAAIAASLGLPSMAVAQTNTVSFACRPAASGETATATVQNTPVVCHAVNLDKLRQAMTSAMTGLTPDQQAKVRFMMQVFNDEMMIESRYPGYNGNPNN
jgi:hypothetical protein